MSEAARKKEGGRAAARAVRAAMRVVHPVCCGIDVHRSVIVCTIARSPEGSQGACFALCDLIQIDFVAFRFMRARRAPSQTGP